MNLAGGAEWIVDARGCNPSMLRDVAAVQALLQAIIHDINLQPVAPPCFHQFDGEAGITGMILLKESHLACHTFPEFRSLCLNLFCCREHPLWDFTANLRERFEADSVSIRRVERHYRPAIPASA